jgi:hypothetical protein
MIGAGAGAADLARRGMTGPPEIFEGPGGLFKMVTGPFELRWAAGPDETVVSGGVRSTRQVREAGVASVFPAVSVALTSNVCVPSDRASRLTGVVQGASTPASSRHWKVEPASLAENVNAAEEAFVSAVGPESIVVSGAVASIVHVWAAGVGSLLPAGSVARTWTVCVPSARPR